MTIDAIKLFLLHLQYDNDRVVLRVIEISSVDISCEQVSKEIQRGTLYKMATFLVIIDFCKVRNVKELSCDSG